MDALGTQIHIAMNAVARIQNESRKTKDDELIRHADDLVVSFLQVRDRYLNLLDESNGKKNQG